MFFTTGWKKNSSGKEDIIGRPRNYKYEANWPKKNVTITLSQHNKPKYTYRANGQSSCLSCYVGAFPCCFKPFPALTLANNKQLVYRPSSCHVS